ncbi:MAG: valyl-tRNA synthetase [Erysipelotrichaceae bacterium]|nr:MAG: valyl-tRNA [Erysipelotrichaceae bacterium]TXT16963.1 MAG: valyl-tRNA synthetase [Erysipelotrichaceae bacterium]
MRKQLDPKYDHKAVESNQYQTWIHNGYFTAGDLSKKPFTIVIPPPNVTGKLHLGHAWDTSLQDIIARFKRMQGFDMLWLPGMDHAGIATQAKVDARLRAQGTNRFELGREKFLEQAWDWKAEYASFIRQQWATLGLSLDYTRERFTLDEGLNKAVNKVFVDLYHEGLIYQGERIINWDPLAKTALSNIEVIHKEIEGSFYTFSYEVVETGEKIAVSTTRPETMFGDVCVVVHPEDERYLHLHGHHIINPANHEVLPIITDPYIDREFGTGAMKCTPAHDPNDFNLSEKHNLPKIICMNPDGTMNEKAGDYCGLDRFECRKQLTQRITDEGNMIKIEKHIHQVGHSERTDVIVEPYLSKQWFVKMKPLAQAAIDAQSTADKVNFIPERFEHIFTQWMTNIEDWCISRQLWWGHRIPVWYHNETKEVYVGLDAPTDIENWSQDEDVLDTWFSSALWPFSTLGWPEKTADLERYYPTDVMVTGYDIIFFWAARMIFQARYFTKSVPFKDAFIHGLIRADDGRKMSKSLSNGVDPLDVIDEYGADALRYFLTTNSAPGLDLRYSTEKVEAAWNFINKLWNASRFVLMNIPDEFIEEDLKTLTLSSPDRWIMERFDVTLDKVTSAMEKYDFALAGSFLYEFVWDDYCSWYIELSKSNLNSSDEATVKASRNTLVAVLKGILKLIHPTMPFVTEKIYSCFEEQALCVSQWPIPFGNLDEEALTQTGQLISIISQIRSIRTEYNVKPSIPLSIELSFTLNDIQTDTLIKMVKTTLIEKLDGETMTRPILGGTLSISLAQLVDVEAEKIRLSKEKEKLEAEISRGESMLSNLRFISAAPAPKVEAEKKKLAEYKRQYDLVNEQLNNLNK